MIISGREVGEKILLEIKKEIDQARTTPCLAVLLVGDHPASMSYIKMKRKACETVGIKSELFHYDPTVTQKEMADKIKALNADKNVHGILLQLPLPTQLDQEALISMISPDKDVDGFHPSNLGKLLAGFAPPFIPCTPLGIYTLLERSHFEMKGKNIVVLGRSRIVGMPLAALLSSKMYGNATVTVCHSQTKNLADHTQKADILIAAMGSPHFVTAAMIKEGSVIIDVGINRVEDPTREKGFRLVGDVVFEECFKKAQAITPVPGGVGPMTVAMLMYNTWQACSKS